MNFELTDDNNRSESAAKNDILRGTAKLYNLRKYFFTLMIGGWSLKRKAFMYDAKQSTHSQVITLFEKFFLIIY